MNRGSQYVFSPKGPTGSAEEQTFLSKMPATYFAKWNGLLMFSLKNGEEYYLPVSQKDDWFILPYEEPTQEEEEGKSLGQHNESFDLGNGIESSNLDIGSQYFIRFRKGVSTPEEHAIQSQMPASYLGKIGDVLGFRLQNGSIYEITQRTNTFRDKDENEMIIREYVGKLDAGKLEGKDYSPKRRKRMIGDIMISAGYGDAGLEVLGNDDDVEEKFLKRRLVKTTNEKQFIRFLEKNPFVNLWSANPTISPSLRNRRFKYTGKRPDSPNVIVFQSANPLDDELEYRDPVECFYENGNLVSVQTGAPISLFTIKAEEIENGKMGDEEEGSRRIRELRQSERPPVSFRVNGKSKRRRLDDNPFGDSSGGKSRRRKHKRRKCKRKSFRKNHY